jgi:hypothetical protein
VEKKSYKYQAIFSFCKVFTVYTHTSCEEEEEEEEEDDDDKEEEKKKMMMRRRRR